MYIVVGSLHIASVREVRVTEGIHPSIHPLSQETTKYTGTMHPHTKLWSISPLHLLIHYEKTKIFKIVLALPISLNLMQRMLIMALVLKLR
jgi:hypothetical protein